jgi:hypothetical protein
MKTALPQGWFARILLIGWACLLVGTLLIFVLAVLAPGVWAGHMVTPLWVLSILVMLGSFAYVAAYATGRVYYYGARARRKNSGDAPAFVLGPVERILASSWLLFMAAALGASIFSRNKWVLAFGFEVLFWLFCVVLLCSTGYGSYLLLREVMKHLRRG